MADKSMTLRKAAADVLRAGSPKQYQALTGEILAIGVKKRTVEC